jgi:hypothetical protein
MGRFLAYKVPGIKIFSEGWARDFSDRGTLGRTPELSRFGFGFRRRGKAILIIIIIIRIHLGHRLDHIQLKPRRLQFFILPLLHNRHLVFLSL